MKGLLIKDIILLKNQWKTFAAFIFLGFFMSMSMKDNAGIVYMAVIVSMFSLSTLGYDEFDNGFRFLFTLPTSRKAYVREKYLFFIISWILGVIIGCGLGYVAELIKDTGSVENYCDTVAESVVGAFLVGSFYSGLLIPIRIKYDAEKAKLVNFAIIGCIAVIAYLIFQTRDKFGSSFANLLDAINKMSDVTIFAILTLTSLSILLISQNY